MIKNQPVQDIAKRYGRFDIAQDLIDDHPDVVQAVLATVLVVRAEAMFHNKSIEYVALSSEFEVVNAGLMPIHYDCDFDMLTGTVTWTKKG